MKNTNIMKCRAFLVLSFILAACGGQNNTPEETTAMEHCNGVVLSEREQLLYDKTFADVTTLESELTAIDTGQGQDIAKVLNDIRKLQYHYNDKGMNDSTRQYCKELSNRVTELKERAKLLGTTQVHYGESAPQLATGKVQLIEHPEYYPYYLEAGDILHYNIESENRVKVSIYNADRQSKIKSYTSNKITDSLKINYSAIYLISIEPQGKEYVKATVKVKNGEGAPLHRPKVKTEQVACKKGDFGAIGIETIKMVNIFDEVRKFTLRGQIKSKFSGTSRALVAIQVPTGATDIMYSMRISTSEQNRSEDGDFYNKLGHSYHRIDIFKLPVYESTRRYGIIDMLLDDNRPIREEDAYCNMYVVRNQSEAKKFQDGTLSASNMKYDVNFSTLGTQSCNGRIPVNGSKTIYLAFENERMRYANYLWVEAVAAIPTTEYYTTKYSVE